MEDGVHFGTLGECRGLSPDTIASPIQTFYLTPARLPARFDILMSAAVEQVSNLLARLA
jgi:hypothetical protein